MLSYIKFLYLGSGLTHNLTHLILLFNHVVEVLLSQIWVSLNHKFWVELFSLGFGWFNPLQGSIGLTIFSFFLFFCFFSGGGGETSYNYWLQMKVFYSDHFHWCKPITKGSNRNKWFKHFFFLLIFLISKNLDLSRFN